MYATLCGTLKFLKQEDFNEFREKMSLFFNGEMLKEMTINEESLLIIITDSFCIDNVYKLVLDSNVDILSPLIGKLDNSVSVVRCFAEDICSCFELKNDKIIFYDEEGENSSLDMILPEGTLSRLYPDTSLHDIITDKTVERSLDFTNNKTDSELRELLELWLYKAVNPICDLFVLDDITIEKVISEIQNEDVDVSEIKNIYGNILSTINEESLIHNDTDLPELLFDYHYDMLDVEGLTPISKITKVYVETTHYSIVFYLAEDRETELIVVTDK